MGRTSSARLDCAGRRLAGSGSHWGRPCSARVRMAEASRACDLEYQWCGRCRRGPTRAGNAPDGDRVSIGQSPSTLTFWGSCRSTFWRLSDDGRTSEERDSEERDAVAVQLSATSVKRPLDLASDRLASSSATVPWIAGRNGCDRSISFTVFTAPAANECQRESR